MSKRAVDLDQNKTLCSHLQEWLETKYYIPLGHIERKEVKNECNYVVENHSQENEQIISGQQLQQKRRI